MVTPVILSILMMIISTNFPISFSIIIFDKLSQMALSFQNFNLSFQVEVILSFMIDIAMICAI